MLPNTVAPELVMDLPYDEKLDIWSLGIIALEIGGKELTYDQNKPSEVSYSFFFHIQTGLLGLSVTF